MLHGILKQHKVHHGVDIIVLTEGVLKHLSELFDVGELVIDLFIEAIDEVGKDKRLGLLTSEVLLQVELGEGLSSDISGDLSVLEQVIGVDESITIDSLSLVHPKFDEHVGFLDDLLLSVEETLEDVGQVTNIELVVEVGSCLSELLGHCDITMELQGSLNHEWNLLKDGRLELGEMLGEVSRVDGTQGGVLGHTHGEEPEMSLESGVDGEVTGLRVH